MRENIINFYVLVSITFLIIAEGIKLRTSKTVSNGTAKPPTSDNFVSNINV